MEQDNAGPMPEDEGQAQGPPSDAPDTPKLAPVAPEPYPRDERIGALEAREKELLDRLARLQADFENFRRRAREEGTQSRAQGKLDFVKELIPVVDNLDRALAHSEDEGLKLLARHVQSTLANAGLVVLAPEGEAFDAKLHEAIAQEQKEGVKAGTVLTVAEKGYMLDGKIVRPARVVVAA